MLKTKHSRATKLWLAHTLLLSSFSVNASNEYLCDITSAPTGRWTSPQYFAGTFRAKFYLWGGWSNSTITLKSDDQNLDAGAINNDIATLRPTLDVLGAFRFSAQEGRATLYQGRNNLFRASGVPGPSFSGRMAIDLGCNNENHCANIRFTRAQNFTYSMDKRLSFAESANINSPVFQKRIVMPSVPRNEYRSHEIRFLHTVSSAVIGISTRDAINIPGGDHTLTFAGGPIVSEIRCVRPATPLTLTLLDNAITFNPAPMGASTPQVKTLRWQASGSGRADIWTMRFTSANATASGDGVLLGGAKVTILDSANQVVPLDQAVTISGTQGEFRLALDARTAQAGNYTSNINLTLTAN
ncbi:hypothetical protein [Edwardsiella hoshinae]|uniref:hypothetical protein n=1 Tax=Edwardsiella hoshinae TaxID=93378 RepID=UPI00041FE7E4|nr:hypothetical protein [Edwardsiella hoshinae]